MVFASFAISFLPLYAFFVKKQANTQKNRQKGGFLLCFIDYSLLFLLL